MLSDYKVPVFPGINDTPRVPTAERAGNGADLIARHNALIDELVDVVSSPVRILKVANSSAQYTSIQTAINEAQFGDLVLIYPGNYYENLILRDRVNLLFLPGAIISKLSSNNAPLISDGGLPVTCLIAGFGEFSGGGNSGEHLILTSNPNSVLRMKAQSITGYGDMFVLGNDGSQQEIEADLIESSSNNQNFVTRLNGGTQNIRAKKIKGRILAIAGLQIVAADSIEGMIQSSPQISNIADIIYVEQRIKARNLIQDVFGLGAVTTGGGTQDIEVGCIKTRSTSISYSSLSIHSRTLIKNTVVISAEGNPINVESSYGKFILWNSLLFGGSQYSIDTSQASAAAELYGVNMANLPVSPNLAFQGTTLNVNSGLINPYEISTPLPPLEPTPPPTPTPVSFSVAPPNSLGYSTAIVTLIGSDGMTALVAPSSYDDHNIAVGDLGFDFPFYEGIFRNDVFVGSNGYITFGNGYNYYSGLTRTSLGKALAIAAADNSYQQVFSRQDDPGRSFRIRYEGTNLTGGSIGSPNLVWEVTLFADGTIQLVTGDLAPRSNALSTLTKGDNTYYTDYPLIANTSIVFLRRSVTLYDVYQGSYVLPQE